MEKIISVGRDELSEWDFERLEKLEFDLMVYGYENGGYDGSGFAAFKKGEQWFYQELGHCSCNGPLENVETSANMLVSLEQVIALAEDGYSDSSKKVTQYLKKNFVDKVDEVIMNLSLRYNIPDSDPDWEKIKSLIV